MGKKIKNIVILGSTGSIGINTLRVIKNHPDKFRVFAIAARSNVEGLSNQVKYFNPEYAVIADSTRLQSLKRKTNRTKIKILSGSDAINEIVKRKFVDTVVVAISGASALIPLMAAIESKKDIALANKESLVMAGSLIMNKVKSSNISLIPVDSEHSAIFQCLQGNSYKALKSIYITGSGGPLDKTPKSKLKDVTPKKALSHPKWKMGEKITVDSATLMNKGLEVIEAMHLFSVPIDHIKVLIHPETIIHSMVEFIDGSILAQLGITDMRLPIQYALSYPERIPLRVQPLDFSKYARLTFRLPDTNKFPSLELAYQAAIYGGTYPACLNAANEELVYAYLRGQIKLTHIPKIIEKVLFRHKSVKHPQLSDILGVDKYTRELTKTFIAGKGR